VSLYKKGIKTANKSITEIETTITILEKHLENFTVIMNAIAAQIMLLTMKSSVLWECFINFSLRENISIMLHKYKILTENCFDLFEDSMASP